jgi:hypothetical protein
MGRKRELYWVLKVEPKNSPAKGWIMNLLSKAMFCFKSKGFSPLGDIVPERNEWQTGERSYSRINPYKMTGHIVLER